MNKKIFTKKSVKCCLCQKIRVKAFTHWWCKINFNISFNKNRFQTLLHVFIIILSYNNCIISKENPHCLMSTSFLHSIFFEDEKIQCFQCVYTLHNKFRSEKFRIFVVLFATHSVCNGLSINKYDRLAVWTCLNMHVNTISLCTRLKYVPHYTVWLEKGTPRNTWATVTKISCTQSLAWIATSYTQPCP